MSRRRVVVAGAAVVGSLVLAVGARAWFGTGFVEAGGSSVCSPRSGTTAVLVGAAFVKNTRSTAVRLDDVATIGGSGVELDEGLWAKRLDPAGDETIGTSVAPTDLDGYMRVEPGGLVVDPGEEWSLVVGLVSPPAGGRVDGFDVRWSRGPFEYRSRTGPAVTIVPTGATCT